MHVRAHAVSMCALQGIYRCTCWRSLVNFCREGREGILGVCTRRHIRKVLIRAVMNFCTLGGKEANNSSTFPPPPPIPLCFCCNERACCVAPRFHRICRVHRNFPVTNNPCRRSQISNQHVGTQQRGAVRGAAVKVWLHAHTLNHCDSTHLRDTLQ